ncbi:MAG: hypothetical protein GZ090_01420 [Oxalobacteraceae bacterium]|nr:hypothetical protein [Oxalobacteraceae bacterium]
MSDSKTIQVTLTQPHTHAGVRHAAGAIITVPAADAQWLQKNGIGSIKPSRPSIKNLGVTHE